MEKKHELQSIILPHVVVVEELAWHYVHLVLQRDFTSEVPAVGPEVACDGSSRQRSCGVAIFA